MIKGCVGFSYVSGHLLGHMLFVRGKRTLSLPLPLFMIKVMAKLWKRENILGKILFVKPKNDFQSLAR